MLRTVRIEGTAEGKARTLIVSLTRTLMERYTVPPPSPLQCPPPLKCLHLCNTWCIRLPPPPPNQHLCNTQHPGNLHDAIRRRHSLAQHFLETVVDIMQHRSLHGSAITEEGLYAPSPPDFGRANDHLRS